MTLRPPPPALTGDELFKIGVYDLALGLMMQETGASDPWHPEAVKETVAYLQGRLAQWDTRPGSRSQRFDEAVREVVLAALDFIERRLTAEAPRRQRG